MYFKTHLLYVFDILILVELVSLACHISNCSVNAIAVFLPISGKSALVNKTALVFIFIADDVYIFTMYANTQLI